MVNSYDKLAIEDEVNGASPYFEQVRFHLL